MATIISPPVTTWTPTTTPANAFTPVANSAPSFNVIPIIFLVTPDHGVAGTQVTISGQNLSNVTSVTFGGVSATIVSKTDRQIIVIAPTAPQPGFHFFPVVVSTPLVTGEPPLSFIYDLNFAAWDPATAVHVNLSNNNLTAQNATASDSTNGVKGTNPQSSGKYYFEIQVDNGDNLGGLGICSSSASFSNLNSDGTGGVVAYAAGQVWSNGGRVTIGGISASVDWNAGANTIVGVAFDSANVWFKTMASLGNGTWDSTNHWNDDANNAGSASWDPSSNIGGIPFSGTIVPFVSFAGNIGRQFTVNFGLTGSWAIGTPPSGFTTWPGQ